MAGHCGFDRLSAPSPHIVGDLGFIFSRLHEHTDHSGVSRESHINAALPSAFGDLYNTPAKHKKAKVVKHSDEGER